MTHEDIEKECLPDPDAEEGRPAPMATMMKIMMLAGRDTQAQICPVLAHRLRQPQGRDVVSHLRQLMQDWQDRDVARGERSEGYICQEGGYPLDP